MIKLWLLILMGWAGATMSTSSTITENCVETCTEEEHDCEPPQQPGPGGENGHTPPDKP
jgi:hypothetical protein